MTPTRSLFRTLALILSLLLSACAVSRQGDGYQFGSDPDELNATTLQQFQLGDTRGVLRRTAQGQVQLKLYDRMKLIDLGRIDKVRVSDALRFPGYDLILLHVPTASCPYAYRLYQLHGYDVGMWDLNNRAGNCGVPLSFSADAQAWVAQQQSTRPDRTTWAWSGGQLISGTAPAGPAATGERGRMASGEPGAGAPAPAAAAKPASGMRFESADGGNNRATGSPGAGSGNSSNSSNANNNNNNNNNNGLAAPANSSKRLDPGNYARLPVATGSAGEVLPPTRIILRNSNGGDADAAPQR